MSDYVVRPAGPEDRKRLEDLIGRCYAVVYPGWYEDDLLEDAMPAMLRIDAKLLSSGHYFVAERNGVAIGCGGWSKQEPGGGGQAVQATGHIRHFATDPDQMRSGVGSAILERCVTEARSAGLSMLKCFSSLPAVAFYERHDFRKIDDVTITLGESIPFPAVLMQRTLV